jgi:hypothetical protein
MNPFEIVRKNITKVGPDWQVAADQTPAEMRVWSGFLAFVPGDAMEIRKRVDAVKISYRADIIPEKAGAWVMAGYNDLEKIVRALRQPA